MYLSEKDKLQVQLNTIPHIDLTTDIWNSNQTRSYCCVTAHYITESWDLKSAVLETFEFTTSHTAENISSELLRVATAWNIQEKVVCVVTDNASNIVAAINKTTWRHLPCFAHSLNLVVQGTISDDPELNKVQQKCQDTMAHFHRSVKSAEKLREVLRQLSLPEHKMIIEVSTRWNSNYLMFERVTEQYNALTTALCLTNQSTLCYNNDEKSIMSNSLTLFHPFLEATENISGESTNNSTC